MAITVLSLTQNGDYFAMISAAHKADIVTCNITKNSVFAGAKLVETRAYLLKTKAIAFDYSTPYNDSNGLQTEHTSARQLTRSTASEDIAYIYTVVDATPATNIEFATTGLFKTNILETLILTVE